MPALITAVEKSSISVATWAGKQYNYMLFRTSSGGMEIGSAILDGHGAAAISSYWPYGGLDQSGSAFSQRGFDFTMFSSDPSGTFLKLADDNGSFDYVFGTANGVFAADTPNGAILGLKKAASKDFDRASAGTYRAIYYLKTGASNGPQNMETGTPSLGKATLIIGAAGEVTMKDDQGVTVMHAMLTPVADTGYLYGGGSLADTCYGVFTFRVTTGSFQQDMFLTFMDRAFAVFFVSRGFAVAAGRNLRLFVWSGVEVAKIQLARLPERLSTVLAFAD